MTPLAPLQRALLRVILDIYERGVVTPAQRLSLMSIHRGEALNVCEREDVFEEFLRETWGDIIDEERLTAEDWARLAMVVRELRLPTHRVPFPQDVELAS